MCSSCGRSMTPLPPARPPARAAHEVQPLFLPVPQRRVGVRRLRQNNGVQGDNVARHARGPLCEARSHPMLHPMHPMQHALTMTTASSALQTFSRLFLIPTQIAGFRTGGGSALPSTVGDRQQGGVTPCETAAVVLFCSPRALADVLSQSALALRHAGRHRRHRQPRRVPSRPGPCRPGPIGPTPGPHHDMHCSSGSRTSSPPPSHPAASMPALATRGARIVAIHPIQALDATKLCMWVVYGSCCTVFGFRCTVFGVGSS